MASFWVLAIVVCFSFSDAQSDTISLLKKYPNSFVTRKGNKLYIENNEIRMAGGNIYWAGLDENGSPGVAYPSQFRVNDAISTAVYTMGSTMLRTHTLGVSVGQKGLSYEDSLGHFTSTGIAHIDYVIYVAKQHNVRLVIPLTDNWDYYHGGELTFTRWRGSGNQADFYSNQQIIADFKNYISNLLNHVNNYTQIALKDEPTIMAWETGNELGQSGAAMPPSWSQMICQYIRSLSGKQLILNGRNGVNAQELTFDCFDMHSQHYYPMNVGALQKAAKQVSDANKVFLAGEYGWNQGGGTSLSAFLSEIESGTTNMDAYWSLFPHNDSYGFEYHGDGLSLYYPGNQPNNNQQQNVVYLRDHAYKMAGAAVPSYPLCGTPKITQVAGSRSARTVYWRGGYGCFDYQIKRNDKGDVGNDADWISKVQGLNDFSGYWQDREAIASSQACTYYLVQGENYDKKWSNYSDVASICF